MTASTNQGITSARQVDVTSSDCSSEGSGVTPAPPRMVELLKLPDALKVSLPPAPRMEEALTPARVKVSLEPPAVTVELTREAANSKVLTPSPPTTEVLETPALKRKVSLEAPPISVEAVMPPAPVNRPASVPRSA